MNVAISLVALALGYKVFADAHKEKEGLKLLGQIIGVVVMIASVLALTCGAAKCMKNQNCFMISKSNCPLMAKTGSPQQSAEAPNK